MYVAIAKNTSMTGQEITLGKRPQMPSMIDYWFPDRSRLRICDEVVRLYGMTLATSYFPFAGHPVYGNVQIRMKL
jgi:hypothetical protein